MTIHGIGIDLVDVARIVAANKRHGPAFAARFLIESERRYCEAQSNPAKHQAARFAAKEAVAKALGTGIGRDCSWHDIEIVRSGKTGAPSVVLTGAAAAFAARHRIGCVHVSISHTGEVAVAQALAEREP